MKLTVSVLVIGAAIAAGESLTPPKPTGGSYTDRTNAFSLELPSFPMASPQSPAETVIILTSSAPPADGFAPNINVAIQAPWENAKKYWEYSEAGFRAYGMQIHEKKELRIGGNEALLIDYGGSPQGKELRFLAAAILTKEKTFLITCTAAKESFGNYQEQFRECLENFRLVSADKKGTP